MGGSNVTKWETILKILEEYYAKRGKRYPWRYADAYGVLVAEVLLQRTPADRVLKTYEVLLTRYPSPRDLAQADKNEVEELVGKLGLKKRGAWLVKACQRIVDEYGGVVPTDERELLRLEGVGPYVARVVELTARGRGRIPVDANVRRVLTRLGVPREEWDSLEVTRSAFWGLVDLARELCGREPRCRNCPLSPLCPSSTKLQSA